MHETVEAVLKAETSEFEKSRIWEEEGVRAFKEQLELLLQIQTPTDEDKQKRLDVLDRIDGLVRSGLNDKEGMYVQPYGSFVSDLYTPTGDLDLAIEGCMRPQGEPAAAGKELARLPRTEMLNLFEALTKKLVTEPGLVYGFVESRVYMQNPLIIFTDAESGIHCDLNGPSAKSRFKSKMLGYLTRIDPRFGALVRIVKTWAVLFEMNNAVYRHFNTFALTNLVVFHLQQRKPPILPPLYRLWGGQPEEIRPLQEASERSFDDSL